MKKKRHPKKSNTKATAEDSRAVVKSPARDSVSEPGGPPLTGEALELKVAEVLCGSFRKTEARDSLSKACRGAEQTAIEAAIVSPRVQNVVEPVTQAFALEQTIAVIHLLLCNARAALESEKPTPAQVTALKIVFETLAEKMLARIGGGLWKESAGLLVFSDYEKSLIENLLQTVRGQRTPVAEDPQRAPDSGQNDEKGD